MYQSDEIAQTIGHIGQTEKNIGPYREYRVTGRPAKVLYGKDKSHWCIFLMFDIGLSYDQASES